MSVGSLAIASCLVIIPVIISYKEKLGLEKEILVAIIRAIIQLMIVGYLLNIVFDINHPIFIIGLVFVMMCNAAFNTQKRGGQIQKATWKSFIALWVGTSMTLMVLVISGVIEFTAEEIIPISGMIISNAMVAIGLSYKSLNTAFTLRKAEIETKLSLGASTKEASRDILHESIKVAITPTIDSAKTLGIVSLPGMMTGLILGGASPLLAVKFQIMVTFMIISSSSMATFIATYLACQSFYNTRCQLTSQPGS